MTKVYLVACDVGTKNLGFAFWDAHLCLIDFLTLCPKSKENDGRLFEVYDFCKKYSSSYFVYERPVFNKGFRFAASLSEMVGILKLAYRRSKIFSYTATEVKKIITGNGKSDKVAVLQSIEKLYKKDFRGATDHAVDAVAIGHCFFIKEKKIP